MRVLGVDPGSRTTGYGVVESTGGNLLCIDQGCLSLGSDDLSGRLKKIFDGLSGIIERTSPDVVAIEKVFMATNANSALVLGHARGSAVCAVVNHDLPVVEYTALQVKRAVVGTGGAAKQQVQHMVRALLGLTQNPAMDAADALACAICHVHTAEGADKIKMSRMAAR